MKKTLAVITTATLFLTTAGQSFALNACPSGLGGSLCKYNGNANSTLNSVLPLILQAIFVLSAIVALLYLIWGGFRWITSRGEKAGVEAARSQIINALIGLVLIFLSYVILNVVLGFFGLNINSISLPTL